LQPGKGSQRAWSGGEKEHAMFLTDQDSSAAESAG